MNTHSAVYTWYVVILLAVVNAFNFMDRMALAVLAPLIKKDLHLSDSQLGLLIGFAFSLFYALCGIPVARLADRGVRRNVIVVALVTWSLMTALNGAAQNFWHLFLARMGVGVGESGCTPPAQSMICDYVPPERRSGMFAIHSFGLYVGMMVGLGLAGGLAEAVGWRWTFVILGLPGVILAAIVRLTLREPPRGVFEPDAQTEVREPFTEVLRILWQRRTFRRLFLFMAANGFAQFGLNQWLPSFYSRVLGLSLSHAGVYLGIAIGVSAALGLLMGGLFANMMTRRNGALPLRHCAWAALLALPAVLGALFVPSPNVSLLLISLATLLWSFPNGAVTAALYSVIAPRMRATAGSMVIFAIAVLGSGLGPLSVGVISDLLTPALGVQALRYGLLAPVSLIPVMAMLLLLTARVLPHDLKALGQS